MRVINEFKPRTIVLETREDVDSMVEHLNNAISEYYRAYRTMDKSTETEELTNIIDSVQNLIDEISQ